MNTFNLPDLGEGLPDAEIVEWLVAEGDTVKVDDPIVSMETAKAVVEVPSPYAGKVAKFHGQAGDVIKTGAPLARALNESGHFPRLALQMVNVGEETGQLDEMLLKVADTYDREVRTTIDRIMAMLVPALTLGLAALIGVIVMSVLMAILSINELVA